MNKKRKDTSNLIFSAFLVTAFVVCSYFFNSIIQDSTGLSTVLKNALTLLIFLVFGLLLFYATRVGDGKQIARFSLSTLILMDLPAIYIIAASLWDVLPFYSALSQNLAVAYLASAALGYGIPYTFLSGYEIDNGEAENIDEENGESEPDENDEPDYEPDNETDYEPDETSGSIDETTDESDEIDDEIDKATNGAEDKAAETEQSAALSDGENAVTASPDGGAE